MTNCSIFPLITGDEVENSTGLSPNNQKQSGTIRRYFLDGPTMPMTLETHLRSPGALCASCDRLWGRPNPPCFSFTLSHWKKPNELSVRWGFPSSSDSKKKKKKISLQCRRPGFDPGSGRFPREGNGNALQYSCLENSMDRGAWWATVHRVTKSQTRLSD